MADPIPMNDLIYSQLTQLPVPWIEIRGSHHEIDVETQQRRRVVDFDLKVDCSELHHLTKIEIRAGDDSEWEMIDSDDHREIGKGDNEQWGQHFLTNEVFSTTRNVFLQKIISDHNHPVIMTRIQTLAKQVAYGENVEVTFHDFTSRGCFTSGSSGVEDYDSNNETLYLKAGFDFQWSVLEYTSSPPQRYPVQTEHHKWQTTWLARIQHAMVDQKSGWIRATDEVPPGIAFTRALREKNLMYNHQTTCDPDG